MTTNQIKKATKQMTFNQATKFIETLGFELVPSENYAFLKSWQVKNNKEIFRITNTMNTLQDEMSDVTFCFY